MLITISLETLLALNDQPAELAGYGPIPAALARDLARHGTWRCAAVDPDHGTLLGLGHRTYRPQWTPSRRLRSLVEHTYRHCTHPGCAVPATRCDVEHIAPWRPHGTGGATCSCNTHPLCRRHHRLKTAGLIRLSASTDPHHPRGTLLWTTLTGRRYLTTPIPLPDPTTTDLAQYRPWPPHRTTSTPAPAATRSTRSGRPRPGRRNRAGHGPSPVDDRRDPPPF